MKPQSPFAHVPRRLMNLVVIGVGLPCILVANALNWSAVASFLFTAALILLSLFILAAFYPKKGR
ncbi:MAG: hypothetical protein NZ571_13520 [Anaerolineae bacterium]|nr:hypothetical protein [Anaerolineae bacterium]